MRMAKPPKTTLHRTDDQQVKALGDFAPRVIMDDGTQLETSNCATMS